MKKTTELKIRIAIRWLHSFICIMIAAALVLSLSIHFDLGLGWALIMPVPFGFIIASPFLIRDENIINHYAKILQRKTNKEAK